MQLTSWPGHSHHHIIIEPNQTTATRGTFDWQKRSAEKDAENKHWDGWNAPESVQLELLLWVIVSGGWSIYLARVFLFPDSSSRARKKRWESWSNKHLFFDEYRPALQPTIAIDQLIVANSWFLCPLANYLHIYGLLRRPVIILVLIGRWCSHCHATSFARPSFLNSLSITASSADAILNCGSAVPDSAKLPAEE